MRKSLAAAALFALCTIGTVEAQSSATKAVVNPGDVLRVTVWRDETLSGEFAVSMDGTVAHPLYRELNVAGKTVPEIEAQFRVLLSRLNTQPQFVIEPLVRISVGGEVRTPNLYTVPPLTTLSQAVALAGGVTDRGKLERVRVFREGREIVVDMTRPEAGLAQEPVQSGDQIYVDRRVSFFREYIAPAGSITAALAAIANIILR